MAQMLSAAHRSRYPRMSYEEYLDDPTIDENTEWVDGEVVSMVSVTELHADLTGFLMELLRFYVRAKGLGRVFAEPFNMKLARGRAPDLLFVRNEHLDQIRYKNLQGPADLVVEVISPGTENTDRGDKFLEYQAGGVPEYWIIGPEPQVADFFERDETGLFRKVAPTEEGVYGSPALDGLKLKVQWLWDRPPVFELLAELGLR